MFFAIIETEAGLTVAQVTPETDAEETAAISGGTLVDPGPFKSFDDAYDAMLALSRGDRGAWSRLRE
jgi:hypothetical protein